MAGPSAFSLQSAVDFMLRATRPPASAGAPPLAAAAPETPAVATRTAAAQTSIETQTDLPFPSAASAVRTHTSRPSTRIDTNRSDGVDHPGIRTPRTRRGTLDSAFVPMGEEEEEEGGFSQWCKYTTEAILAGAPQLAKPLLGVEQDDLHPADLLECESMLLDEVLEDQQQPQEEQPEQEPQRYELSSAIPADREMNSPALQLPIHQEVAGLPISLVKPLVSYRVATAADWPQLQQLHSETFPFVYDDSFYSYICSGRGFGLVATVKLQDLRKLQQRNRKKPQGQQQRQQQQQEQQQQEWQQQEWQQQHHHHEEELDGAGRSNSCNSRSVTGGAATGGAPTEAGGNDSDRCLPSSHSWHGTTTTGLNQHGYVGRQELQEELILGVITVSQNAAYIRPEDAQAVRLWMEEKDESLLQAAVAAANEEDAASDNAPISEDCVAKEDDTPHENGFTKDDGSAEEREPKKRVSRFVAEEDDDVERCCMHPEVQRQQLFSLPSLLAALSPENTSIPTAVAGNASQHGTSHRSAIFSADGENSRSGAPSYEELFERDSVDGSFEEPQMKTPPVRSLLPAALVVDPEVKDLAYVLTLAVAAPFRRHGIAADLLNYTVAFLRSAYNPAPAAALYLHVADYNAAALSFYSKHGFYNISYLPSFYCINNKYYGSYLCCLHLHEFCSSCCRSRERQALQQQQTQDFIDRQTGKLVRGLEGIGRALKAVGKSVSAFLNAPDVVNDKQEAQM